MVTREYMLGEHLPDLDITFWVGLPSPPSLTVCTVCTVCIYSLDVSKSQTLGQNLAVLFGSVSCALSGGAP